MVTIETEEKKEQLVVGAMTKTGYSELICKTWAVLMRLVYCLLEIV